MQTSGRRGRRPHPGGWASTRSAEDEPHHHQKRVEKAARPTAEASQNNLVVGFLKTPLNRVAKNRIGQLILASLQRPWCQLTWIRLIDYDHACRDIPQLEELFFGPSSKGRAWAKQMRKYLKTQSNGITRM